VNLFRSIERMMVMAQRGKKHDSQFLFNFVLYRAYVKYITYIIYEMCLVFT